MNLLPRKRGDTEKTGARKRIARGWRSAWDVAVAILREVFDESAYERFLARAGKDRSVDSYREFLREGETAIARKPRCC